MARLAVRRYGADMGMLGELFPGRKLRDESGEDGDGQPVGEQWDIDLDSGVVRLRGPGPLAVEQAPEPQAE